MTFNPWLWRALPGSDAFRWAPEPLTTTEADAIGKARAIYQRRLELHGYSVDDLTGLAVCLLGHQRIEHSYAFFFTLSAGFLGYELVARGSAGRVNPCSHVMARHAIERGASWIVDAHNHPSGVALPSDGDERATVASSATFAAAGVMLFDSWVIAGTHRFSMAGNDVPAGAWFHQRLEPASRGGEPRVRSPMSRDELLACQEAERIIATRHPVDPPAERSQLLELADAWMSTRSSPAIGIVACDIFRRPLACHVLSNGADEHPYEMLTRAVQFLVRECAQRAVIVSHAAEGATDLQALRDLADELDSMIRPYDLQLVDGIETGATANARSLVQANLFHTEESGMKVADIFRRKREAEKAQQEQASASLAAIARKSITGADLSAVEKAAIDSGQITEQQVTAAAEVLRRWDAKLANAVAVERKRRVREPQIKAAQARLPKLEKELIECRQLAMGMVVAPEYGPLTQLAREHAELLGHEFHDEASIRSFVERAAEQQPATAAA